MHIDELMQHYRPGSTVISPYGLAVISKLFDEPLKERPERPGEGVEWPEGQDTPNYAAARIHINGHGEEVIEIDQLVPATPDTLARWKLSRSDEDRKRLEQALNILSEDDPKSREGRAADLIREVLGR